MNPISLLRRRSMRRIHLFLAAVVLTPCAALGASFKLDWDDNSNDESGFRVERSTNDGAFAVIASLPANTITYTDTTATDGAKVSYRVYAFIQNVANSEVSNVVTNAPVITTQPADQTVSVFQNANFTAAASGIPNPSYQWRKGATPLTNTGNILGANTASLSITNVSFADSGIYSVVVTNGIGAGATSVDATLTVNRSPQTITFNTPPTKVFTDAPFALGATASSALTVTYTSSNPAVATVSGEMVTIVGVGTTTITASQAGDNTYLPAANVQRTLTVNKADQTISFDPLSAVTFGVAPFQITATSTSNLGVTFSSSNTAVATVTGNTVTVVGGGTATITASQAGNANYNPAPGVPRTLTVNPTTQTITFAALPEMVLGDPPVTLVATSTSGLPVQFSSSQLSVARTSGTTLTLVGRGTTTITAAQPGNASYLAAPGVQHTLIVNQAPTFSVHPPANIVSNSGFVVNITVAASGQPSPTLQWQESRDSGATWSDLANVGIYSGVTTTILRLGGITSAMDGYRYRCVATNSVAATPSNVGVLNVQYAPSFTVHPANSFAPTGGGTSFTVTATGNPTPTLQWQISTTAGGGTFTNLSNNATYSGVTTPTLTISGATTGLNNFRYRAVATNSISSANSGFAVLTVGDVAPSFTLDPANLSAPAGSQAVFTAAASGGPAPTLQWQVSSNGGVNWSNLTNAGIYSGVTTGTLTISSAGIALHNYRYRAVATNSAAAVESAAATLTITTTPPSFTAQPANQSAPDAGTATFTATATGNPAPTLKWQVKSTAQNAVFEDIAAAPPYSGVTTGTLTITGVSPALDGFEYRAVATNTDVGGNPVSTNSDVATFTIGNVAPVFTAHPSNRLIAAGASTTFTVAVTGNPMPTLQWQVSTDGNNWTALVASGTYSGVTSNTLTITGATLSLHNRQFRASATNAAATVESQAATLSVTGTEPSITQHPSNRSIEQFSSTSFSIAASGNPAPSYQWQISTDNGATWTDVVASATYSGVNSATLSLVNVPSSLNAARFRAIAANALNTATSNAAQLTVTVPPPPPPPDPEPTPEPPTIQTQPTHQSATLGATANFSVSASGVPVPQYQWRKDGVNISGAVSAVLTIANIAASDAGTYSVVVSNSAGSITSVPATLTVQSAPAFVVQPQSVTVNAGSPANFSVEVSGLPAPSLQWRKNGIAIVGATSTTLVIAAASAADAGEYSVVATNTAGSATSSSATLTVQTAPAFTSQPTPVSANAGSSASFTVQVSGQPTPTLQWRKDGVALPGATSATLTLSNVTATDAGGYTVVATNAVGGVTSAVATLTVNSAPQFTAHPASQTVVAGASVTFTTAASGSPAPTFQWRKGGTPIPGATSASFTISNVQNADAGTYDVVATNSAGSATSQPAALAVNLPSYAGVYFGDLPGGGSWALHIRADNTGTYIAFLADRRTAIVLQVTVAADGSFTVTGTEIVPQTAAEPAPASEFEPPRAAAAAPVVLSGRITNGQITGSLAGLGIAFSGAIDQGTATPATAGFYSATALGTAQGASYSIVGPSGQALAITTSPTAIDGAKGTVSSTGQLTAITPTGGQLAMTVNSQTQSVAVTYTAANTSTPVTFAGVTDAVTAVSNLVNLSVRAPLAANDTLIAGFVVTGSATKKFLIRGIGPGLAGFNEANPLADPVLTLHNRSAVLATNDDWGTPADAAGAIASASTRVGAFTLAGTSRDAALLADIVPGPHTVHVAGKGGAAGVALIELYALDPKEPARLANISARTQVGAGNNVLIVGFVIDGNVPRQVLIRGIGPTLSTLFGIPGAMVDPQVELYEGQTRVAVNDNWSGSELTPAFDRVGAFRLAAGSRDAALLVTLKPGVHSVVLSGVGGTAGVALIEVYEIP